MVRKSLKEGFDPSIADRFLATEMNDSGLPGFLGCSFSEFSPGKLRAEVPVRPDLPAYALRKYARGRLGGPL